MLNSIFHLCTSITNKYLLACPQYFSQCSFTSRLDAGIFLPQLLFIFRSESDLGNKLSFRNIFSVTCLGAFIKMVKCSPFCLHCFPFCNCKLSSESCKWRPMRCYTPHHGQWAVFVTVTSRAVAKLKTFIFVAGYYYLITWMLKQTHYPGWDEEAGARRNWSRIPEGQLEKKYLSRRYKEMEHSRLCFLKSEENNLLI